VATVGEALELGAAAPSVTGARAIDWQTLPLLSLRDGAALRKAIAERRPVVVSDLAADWPALTAWTPEN
jgi:hypothetical protein